MSRSHSWADLADSPLTPTSGLPHPPIPYRQPSYAVAQRDCPLSPPAPHRAVDSTAPLPEEDDGGWTVDYGARSYSDRHKRKNEWRRSREAGSLTSSMSNLAVAQPLTDHEVVSHTPPHPDRVTSPAAADETLPVHAGAVMSSSVEVPPGGPTDVDHQVADVAAGLNRSGYRLDQSIMAKLKHFLQANKLDEAGPLVQPTFQIEQQVPEASNSTPPIQGAPPASPAPAAAIVDNNYALGREYTGALHDAPPHLRYAYQNDPNRLAVANNRWGSTVVQPPSPLDVTAEPVDSVVAIASTTGDATGASILAPALDLGWAPDEKVRAWAADVAPSTPPSRPSPPRSAHLSPPSSPLPRPDSATRTLPPVTVYISDDESASDTDLPTPGKNDPDSSPTIQAVTTPASPALHASGRPVSRVEVARSAAGTDEAERRRRVGRTDRRWEKSGVPWKRDPHPAFSAKFASKRLLIRFPFPIRQEAIKPTMLDHFSRYGSIRMVWSHDPQGDQCEQVLLVFDNEEAIEACFADPRHTDCLIRSTGRAGTHPIAITVTLAPLDLTSRTVYIRMTGPRSDSRSRSAFPPARSDVGDKPHDRHRRTAEIDWVLQSLPASVNIDAVPSRKRFANRIDWWARVRPAHLSFDDISQRAYSETQFGAETITCMDLGRRVAEKDIVPQLCEYFAEIIDIIPPTSREQGWLVTVGGASDGRNLMSEIGKIPGITTRWVIPEDGIVQQDESATVAESPMTRLEKHLGGEMSREDALRSHPRPQKRRFAPSPISSRSRNAGSPPAVNALDLNIAAQQPTDGSHSAKVPAHSTSPPSPADQPAPPNPQATIPHGIDTRYPHLRRRIIPTYRGRALREDSSEETARYFDDSAVFVGRLVKYQETKESLFQRFARYGQICGIEFNPKLVQSTYATARILFSSKAAADRAIEFEHGAVSFGSQLKVEKRRVLPCDVQIEETYVDEWGRACSPSMASQYSPPQLPLEDDMLFVQPPPLATGPMPFPLPLIDPDAFMQPGPGGPAPMWLPLGPGHPLHAALAPSPQPMQPSGSALPSGSNAAGLATSHSQLFPVLYAMGIGMYPPSGHPQVPHPFPGPTAVAASSLPTPPWTPHVDQLPNGTATDPSAPPGIPISHRDSNQDRTLSELHDQVKVEPTSPATTKRRSPTIKGTHMVNGVLKVIYDDDELKQFCQEEGRPEPRPLANLGGTQPTTIQVPLTQQPSPCPMPPPHHPNPVSVSTNVFAASPSIHPIPIPFNPNFGGNSGLHGLGLSGSDFQSPARQSSMTVFPPSQSSWNGHRGDMAQQHAQNGHGGGGRQSWEMRRAGQPNGQSRWPQGGQGHYTVGEDWSGNGVAVGHESGRCGA